MEGLTRGCYHWRLADDDQRIAYLIFPRYMKKLARWSETHMSFFIWTSGVAITILGAVLVYQQVIRR